MDYKQFIDQQIDYIKQTVGSEKAINALSGGVDSSTVTPLPHDKLNRISNRITQIPGANRCLYDLTPKPPPPSNTSNSYRKTERAANQNPAAPLRIPYSDLITP